MTCQKRLPLTNLFKHPTWRDHALLQVGCFGGTSLFLASLGTFLHVSQHGVASFKTRNDAANYRWNLWHVNHQKWLQPKTHGNNASTSPPDRRLYMWAQLLGLFMAAEDGKRKGIWDLLPARLMHIITQYKHAPPMTAYSERVEKKSNGYWVCTISGHMQRPLQLLVARIASKPHSWWSQEIQERATQWYVPKSQHFWGSWCTAR